MKKLVEYMLDNLSTKEQFVFRVSCESCGREYTSKPIRFSKADRKPETKEKQMLYEAIYEQELRDARRLAVNKAAEDVNFCPICMRIVCNHCLLICEDLDMCTGCAANLNDSGVPVFPEALET